MTRTHRILLPMVVLAFSVSVASAQVQTGTPPFGSFGGGPDVINLGNLNVHLTIPVIHKPGRGTSFTYDLSYDSSVWYPVGVSGSQSWQPVNSTWGWKGLAAAGIGFVSYSMVYSSGNCGYMGQSQYQSWSYSNFTYNDEFGIPHPMNVNGGTVFISPGPPNCPPNGPQPPTTPWTGVANDGSGYTLKITPSTGSVSGYVVATNGAVLYPPITSNPSGQQGVYSSTDRNGNRITSSNGAYTDTLGTTALTVAGVDLPPSSAHGIIRHQNLLNS
jgi:hypothetical protein